MPKFSVTLTLTVTADDVGDAVHACTAGAGRADRPLEITNVHAHPQVEPGEIMPVGGIAPMSMPFIDPEHMKEFGKAIGTAMREIQKEMDRESWHTDKGDEGLAD